MHSTSSYPSEVSLVIDGGSDFDRDVVAQGTGLRYEDMAWAIQIALDRNEYAFRSVVAMGPDTDHLERAMEHTEERFGNHFICVMVPEVHLPFPLAVIGGVDMWSLARRLASDGHHWFVSTPQANPHRKNGTPVGI